MEAMKIIGVGAIGAALGLTACGGSTTTVVTAGSTSSSTTPASGRSIAERSAADGIVVSEGFPAGNVPGSPVRLVGDTSSRSGIGASR
jgi:hypothetical protein